MRIGPFTNLISETFGVPEKTTTVVARALREAGWLTSGARGVNAPHMTATDAARLSLALLTGAPPSTVVEEFELIKNLRCPHAPSEGSAVEIGKLCENHTLEEMLTALIESVRAYAWLALNSLSALPNTSASNITVAVDSTRRTAIVQLPNFIGNYVAIQNARETGLDRPAFSNAKVFWELMTSPQSCAMQKASGMRVMRSITQEEISVLAFYLHHADPTSIAKKLFSPTSAACSKKGKTHV
jgi:hypothetical protein